MQMNIKSRFVYINLDNIDTDQIIPSDYLTTTVKSNLIHGLFNEIKSTFSADVLKDIFNPDISILISGENFGCGSSREHAVWALREAGFRIVIAESFADIFKSNALKNSILPIVLSKEDIGTIVQLKSDSLEVDLSQQKVKIKHFEYPFQISSFHKYLFLKDLSEFDYLFNKRSEIADYERKLHV